MTQNYLHPVREKLISRKTIDYQKYTGRFQYEPFLLLGLQIICLKINSL